MIDIASLTDADRGRWVIHRVHPDHLERGRIMTWSNQFLYVVFDCAGQWDRFEDYPPMPCLPEDLEFEQQHA